jgi:hypothetical protein
VAYGIHYDAGGRQRRAWRCTGRDQGGDGARFGPARGPTFVEAVTYRLLMHTTADDPTKYRRSEEEVEAVAGTGSR